MGSGSVAIIASVERQPHHAAPSLFVIGLSAGVLGVSRGVRRTRFRCKSLVDRRGVEPLTSAVQRRNRRGRRTRRSRREAKATPRLRSSVLSVPSLRSRSFPSAEATTRPVLACRAEESWDWWASFKDPDGSPYDPGL